MFITHSWFSSHRWPDRGLILSQQQSLAANVPMRSVPVPSSGVPALRCLDIAALDRHRFWECRAEKPHLTPQKKMLQLRLPTEAQEASCCSPATCSEVAWFAAFCTKNAHGLVQPPNNASVLIRAKRPCPLCPWQCHKWFLLSLVFNHKTLLSTWHFFWWGVNNLEYSWWWGMHTNLQASGRIACSFHTHYPCAFTKRQQAFIQLSNQTDFFLVLFLPRAWITSSSVFFFFTGC